MNILILNQILFTADGDIIPKVKSIKDTLMYNMCLGFKTLGHQVSLVASEEFRPTENETYDFEVIFVKSNLKRLFKPSVLPLSFQLKTFLKENSYKYDLIISSEVFSFQSLFASLICPQKTLIWHELALHPSKFHKIPSKIWYNIIVPLFISKVSCVVPRSVEARDFIKKYSLNVTNECIEHGINIEQLSFSVQKENFLIFVGQLIPRKNIPSIIEKFRLYIKKYDSDCKLLIVGRGFLERSLKDYVKVECLDKNIEFIGFVDHIQLNSLLKKCKAMLIDTLQDNNMVSIPESIVCGTPVITNLVPTNADMIRSHNLGIAKSSWDEDDIKHVIDNNQYYVSNCINFRENLSNNNIAKNLIEKFISCHKR